MDTNDLLNLFLKGCKNKNKKSFEWICLLLKQLEFTVLNVSQVNKEEAIILFSFCRYHYIRPNFTTLNNFIEQIEKAINLF